MTLKVQDDQGNPPASGVATFILKPFWSWEILGNTAAGTVTLRRLLYVTNQSGGQNPGPDITKISFIPDYSWNVAPNGTGAVTINGVVTGARIRLTTDKTVSSSTNYQIPFTGFDLEPAATWSLSTAGTLTVPQAGYYLYGLSVQGDFNSNPAAGDEVSAEIVVANGTGQATNTSQRLNCTSLVSGSSGAIKLAVTSMDYFAANGSVSGYFNASNCSVGTTIRGGGTNGCYLWMARMFGN